MEGNEEMKKLFRRLTGQERCLFGEWFSAIGIFACSVVISTLLLSNCDILGGSIDDFIASNTGEASIKSWAFPPSTRQSRKDEIWMHYPADNYILINLQIENPLKYDLKMDAEIYEFIGENGVVESSAPAAMPVKLTVVDANNAVLKIGEQTSAGRVNLGDSFMIRIHIALADGTRDFGYYNLPQIIYDTMLLPPSNLMISVDPGGSEQPSANWKIQSPETHKGINKISLVFESTIKDYYMGPWDYHYNEVTGKWRMLDNAGSTILEEYRELMVNPVDSTILSLPFPLEGSIDYENFSDNYNYTVTLEDKNHVTTYAKSNGVSELLCLENILVIRKVHDSSDNYTLVKDPVFKYKEGEVSYFLAEPYEVDAVRIEIEKKFNNQRVRFNNNTFAQEEFECGLSKFGVNTIEMIVEWFEPGSETSTNSAVYTFSFYRNPPDRDSTLKELKVKDKKSTPNYYDLSPIFEKPSNNVNEHSNIEKNYTVFVSHDVAEVEFEWDFLSYSVVSSRKSGDSGWNTSSTHVLVEKILDPSFLGSYPAAPASYGERPPGEFNAGEWFYNTTDQCRYDYDGTIWVNTNQNYSQYVPYFANFGEEGSPLGIEVWRSGWSYTVGYGENNIEIMVKPKSGDIRYYYVRVIRAAMNNNPAAKLKTLSVSTGELIPSLSDGLFNYTVNVPYGSASVILNAQAADGASIIEILSNPSVTYTAGGQLIPISITSLVAGQSRPITIKVQGGPIGSAPNNYLVRVNRNLPSITPNPDLKGGDNNLAVSWNSTAGMYYDVCYGTGSTQSSANIWGTKIQAASAPATSTSIVITGLFNNQTYYVWVRQRNADDVVGEWTQARTTTSMNYGKPGVAKLTGLTTTPTGLSPGFSSGIYSYVLDIPSTTDTVEFTPVGETGNTITIDPASGNAPSAPGGTNVPNTITATSPDGKTQQPYTVIVRRMLSAPGGLKLTPKSGSMDVEWNAVTNVNLTVPGFPGPGSYEIFYTNTITNQTKSMEIPATATRKVTLTELASNLYEVSVRAKRSDGLLGHESVDTETPGDGKFTITVTLPGGIPEDYDWVSFWNQTDISCSWGAGGSLNLSIPTSFSSYEWFIDDDTVSTTYSMSVNIRNYSQGTHYLSVRFKGSDGYVYSKSIILTINQ